MWEPGFNAISQRLTKYLKEMRYDVGETPHCFRAGCAISLIVGGATDNATSVMKHVGWVLQEMITHYSRAGPLLNGTTIAENLGTIT